MAKAKSKKTKIKKAKPVSASPSGELLVEVRVNGVSHTWRVPAGEYLLDTLRREGYYSVKRGCETGDCGSCTVLLDGKAVASCMMLTGQVHGRDILTSEGLGHPRQPHPIQQAFVDTGGTQCGFCVPGMVLSAKALLDEKPKPTEEEIKEALDGNLCRCTGYVKQIEAVQKAAQVLAAGKKDR